VTDAGTRVVLVTGASSGIGLATAVQSAEASDHVVLLARGRSALESAAEKCRRAGAASVRVAAVDVTDADAVGGLVADLLASHGAIDAVVHCAGVVAYGRFEDVPEEVFDQVISTNVLGAANVVRSVLPSMRERDHGTIVLLGSVLGTIAAPTMSAYAISKWGVRSLARQLQIENRDRSGVHICCVSPGGVDTPIYLQAANYLGRVGRPPPPAVAPEKVASTVLGVLRRPRARVNVGAANPLMTFGFTVLPGVFDALVGPLFALAATDERHRVEPGTGNVLRSVPDGNRLRGEQAGSLTAIALILRSRATDAVRTATRR